MIRFLVIPLTVAGFLLATQACRSEPQEARAAETAVSSPGPAGPAATRTRAQDVAKPAAESSGKATTEPPTTAPEQAPPAKAAQQPAPQPTPQQQAPTAGPPPVDTTLRTAADVPSDARMGDDAFTGFAQFAFPPTLPDAEFHRDAWIRGDCLKCHATGQEGAPVLKHAGMSPLLTKAQCRSCHVIAPAGEFAYNAFPPTLPDDNLHVDAWSRSDCLLCHESGIRDAPIVRHRGMSPQLLKAQCRSCHVVSSGGVR